MTFRLSDHAVSAILLDIEGTTTPIAFVYDVLFPYARGHLREYLREYGRTDGVRDGLAVLREEWRQDAEAKLDPPSWHEGEPESGAVYLEWLMDRDRKSPALKLLQGYVWEQGYRSGQLNGEVFPDVRTAFERWRASQIAIAIYSSGSVLAQQLLFGATPYGDLTLFIAGFFDTAVGAKTSPPSYTRIADALKRRTGEILFVSDLPAEIEAARSAGCRALLAMRPGNRPVPEMDADTIGTFDEIV